MGETAVMFAVRVTTRQTRGQTAAWSMPCAKLMVPVMGCGAAQFAQHQLSLARTHVSAPLNMLVSPTAVSSLSTNQNIDWVEFNQKVTETNNIG